MSRSSSGGGGSWPCQLPILSAHAYQDEGMEMVSPAQAQATQATQASKPSAGPSPTCVMAAASQHWESGRGAKIDSVMEAISPGVAFSKTAANACDAIAKGSVPWASGTQNTVQYGKGGVFAAMRGAHASYQSQTESEAATARHKATMSLALNKTRPAVPEGKLLEVKKEPHAGSSLIAGVSAAMDVMEKRMRKIDGLLSSPIKGASEQSTRSNNTHLTSTMQTPRAESGGGVRASAFALITQKEQKRRDNQNFRAPNEVEWMTSSVPVPDVPLAASSGGRQANRNESDSDQEGQDVPEGPICLECNEW